MPSLHSLSSDKTHRTQLTAAFYSSTIPCTAVKRHSEVLLTLVKTKLHTTRLKRCLIPLARPG